MRIIIKDITKYNFTKLRYEYYWRPRLTKLIKSNISIPKIAQLGNTTTTNIYRIIQDHLWKDLFNSPRISRDMRLLQNYVRTRYTLPEEYTLLRMS